MPLFTGATHKLIGGHNGPMSAHLGVVLHVNESNGNLDNWVRDQSHDMSCHFEVYKDGTATQYVDTAFGSWCQMDGNQTYLSIETEGYATEALTPAQVDRVANLVAQAHLVHGIPLELADKPGQRGLGWHGMGGAAWGGHTGCPGNKRKAQRKTILAKAAALVAARAPKPTPAPAPKPTPAPAPKPTTTPTPRPLYTQGAPKLISPAGRNAMRLTDAGLLEVWVGDKLAATIDPTKIGHTA